MSATDARPIPKKNVAFRVTLALLDADGDLVTGATGLDSEVSLDGGTFADCTNEATEIATASGMYYLDLTAAELNADTVAIIVKTTSSGAKTTPIVLYPEEAGDIRVDVTQVSGDTTAADNAEAFFDGTGYAGTNNVIPTVTTLTNLPTITANWLTSAGTHPDFTTEIQTGLSTLDAAGVRTAVGLGSANLDTQLAAIAGFIDAEVASILAAVDTEVAAIKTKTDQLTFTTANKLDAKLTSDGFDFVLLESSITAGAGLTNDTGTQLTSINARQGLSLLVSTAGVGVLAGAAGVTITTKPAGKPTGNTRVTATVDADGNRPVMVIKVPD